MGRILIVDDRIESCRPLAALVRHLGHNGDYATNGPTALEYLRKQLPDLLILDVMMPGMDGMEVLGHIRADARYARMSVVMFSALDEHVTRQNAIALGANDFWVKASMDFQQLSERLELLLSDISSKCPIPDDHSNAASLNNA